MNLEVRDLEAAVSVVIPTFDRDLRLLRAAIDSALAQTVPPDELVVVDDGSADPVEPYLADYGSRIRTIYQENRGIGPARNTGIAHCAGNFLAFLDSDDMWTPRKLEVQLDAFGADPTLDAVYGKASHFYDEQTTDEFRARHPIIKKTADATVSTAIVIRRESFDRVGSFSEYSEGVDVEWRLRAVDSGLVDVTLPEVLFLRRIHPGNRGITHRDTGHTSRILAIKESLDRRRAKAAE
jgi:glycosyltransferase involved in cell wall biosynthesis